jgi:hypothetical protein
MNRSGGTSVDRSLDVDTVIDDIRDRPGARDQRDRRGEASAPPPCRASVARVTP